jgi:alkyl sulfatase BDS1-like metallo-beta-lactamase superfamily hydrolase
MLSFIVLSILTIPFCHASAAPQEQTNTTNVPVLNNLTKSSESFTAQMNQDAVKTLPLSDTQDFEDAKRGFIGTTSNTMIKDSAGKIIWSLQGYAFLDKKNPPPSTVNPALWRQAQLNMNHGLFKVIDRIYQVRGFDISNMTIIEGDTGLIIIDPLISQETANAALNLYYKHRPKKPVVAVIYSHSHVDHFGGVKGVVSEGDVNNGKVKILAPEGFMQHAISENVYAGNAMARRSLYMYGALLPRGENGQIDTGLGKNVSLGTITLIAPTDIISKTGETRNIDGIDIVFQMALNTEAPSEMLMYFPQFKALCTAEDATHTLHNLYTLRGAQIRDGAAWWKTLNKTIEMFGDKTDVVFAQHHWPTWGQERLLTFLQNQRNLYKYIHDQTLRLLNNGYTMIEIGDMIELPPNLSNQWYNRGFYGTVNHDAKGVYQRYLGWYDSNPANLEPLSPIEAGKKYVEFMGGTDNVIAQARKAYAKGEYRWVAQVMNHVVFADPTNTKAKLLEADALEQLGYQNENPTWRNEYLMGAYELRHGVPESPGTQTASPDLIKSMPIEMFFDYLGLKLNAPKAQGKKMTFNWHFTDTGKKYALVLEDSVLFYTPDKQIENADTTITLTRPLLNAIILRQTTFAEQIRKGTVKMEGNLQKPKELIDLLDVFPKMFNIVTP